MNTGTFRVKLSKGDGSLHAVTINADVLEGLDESTVRVHAESNRVIALQNDIRNTCKTEKEALTLLHKTYSKATIDKYIAKPSAKKEAEDMYNALVKAVGKEKADLLIAEQRAKK